MDEDGNPKDENFLILIIFFNLIMKNHHLSILYFYKYSQFHTKILISLKISFNLLVIHDIYNS